MFEKIRGMQPEHSHTKASQGNDYISALSFRLVHFHKIGCSQLPKFCYPSAFKKAWQGFADHIRFFYHHFQSQMTRILQNDSKDPPSIL